MLIDAHTHIWHRDMLPDKAVYNYMEPMLKFKDLFDGALDFNLDAGVPFYDYNTRMEEYISMLDGNNVDYAVVLGIDFELVNEKRMTNMEYMDWMFQMCGMDRRFIPFISVDPNKGKQALEDIEKLVKKYDPKGIKVYPATGWYPNDPKYDDYWKLIDDLGLVVTTHAGMALPPLDEKYCHPKDFVRTAEKHPDMKIIIAHLGGKFHDELFPLMDEHENVYTDCSALQGWVGDDESMICKRLDSVTSRYPDRVVFGTDFPLYEHVPMRRFLNIINDGKWGSDSIREKLFGKNMAKLLGL